jgi:WD40 repeat protein
MLGAVLAVMVFANSVADFPPGAVMRLGDARWRVGSRIDRLVFSPDSSGFVTWQAGSSDGVVTLHVWDANSGRLLRETMLNRDLFGGIAWGVSGGFVVVRQVELDREGRGILIPDDFRVWEFTDPSAKPPPLLDRVRAVEYRGYQADIIRPNMDEEFTGFAVSADASRVVAFRISRPKKGATAEVYEIKATNTAKLLNRIRTPANPVITEGALISANGRMLFPYSTNMSGSPTWSSFNAWNLDTGKDGLTLITDMLPSEKALSADGRVMAIAVKGSDPRIEIIETLTKQKLAKIPWQRGPQRDGQDPDTVLALAPDGKHLVVAIECKASVIDVATGKERGRLEGHVAELTTITFSPDGKRIATADELGLIRLWDADTLRPLNDPQGHRVPVVTARLSPDGKHLLTTAVDDTVRIWDLGTGKEMRVFNAAGDKDAPSVASLPPAFTPDGKAIVYGEKDRLLSRDILTGLEVPLPGEMAKLPRGAAVFAPDGKAILTYPYSRTWLTVWEWPTGKERFTLTKLPQEPSFNGPPVLNHVLNPGFSDDGAVFFPNALLPHRCDAITGRRVSSAWSGIALRGEFASILPHQRLAHRETMDGMMTLVREIASSKKPDIRLRQPDPVTAGDVWWQPALSPDIRTLADVKDNRVQLIEVATGEVRRVLTAHSGIVHVLGFTPDCTRLLTAGADHTVLVWDVRPQSVPLSAALQRETDMAKVWTRVCNGKADTAYLAMARLSHEPELAVKTARVHMKPATSPSETVLAHLLDDLGDPEFSIREAAEKELDAFGEPAAAMVAGVLHKLESPEARRRGQEFVKRWTRPGTTPVKLADSRAIELLESCGTPEAREFLKELAAGEANAQRTREAKLALERLGAKH